MNLKSRFLILTWAICSVTLSACSPAEPEEPPKSQSYLDRLAEAFNPDSDLDFDYLGIQTLYDRYLQVDKTSDRHLRIETPQLFWMRVAMGLMVAETGDRESKVIDLYRLSCVVFFSRPSVGMT